MFSVNPHFSEYKSHRSTPLKSRGGLVRDNFIPTCYKRRVRKSYSRRGTSVQGAYQPTFSTERWTHTESPRPLVDDRTALLPLYGALDATAAQIHAARPSSGSDESATDHGRRTSESWQCLTLLSVVTTKQPNNLSRFQTQRATPPRLIVHNANAAQATSIPLDRREKI